MKTQETLRILEKYVPKKLHGAVKNIEKDAYGYEVILEALWLFEKNNTSFYSDTIKELKQDLKKVEQFELENWKNLMKGLGYSLGEIKQLLGETEEVEETEEGEDEEFDFDNVSLKDHQKEMVIGLGFNQDITQEVMDGLKKRDTKVSEDVLNKIQEMFSENKYTILTDGQEVRVASVYLVTQKEKKQIKSITGMRVSDEIHDGIEWLVWLCGEEKNKY